MSLVIILIFTIPLLLTVTSYYKHMKTKKNYKKSHISPIIKPNNDSVIVKSVNNLVKRPSSNNLNYHYTKYDYNHIYSQLSYIIPKQSKSMNFLDELKKNNNKSVMCCNPDCKRVIENKNHIFFAFDGSYCSTYCRDKAISYISHYWCKV